MRLVPLGRGACQEAGEPPLLRQPGLGMCLLPHAEGRQEHAQRDPHGPPDPNRAAWKRRSGCPNGGCGCAENRAALPYFGGVSMSRHTRWPVLLLGVGLTVAAAGCRSRTVEAGSASPI